MAPGDSTPSRGSPSPPEVATPKPSAAERAQLRLSRLKAGIAKAEWPDLDKNPHLQNVALLTEAAEIETRLRQHILELLEPTIRRQRQQDVKLKEAKVLVDDLTSQVSELKRSFQGEECIRAMVEGFRGTLAEWDKERREHEQTVGDRCSGLEIELNELNRSIEKKTADISTSNRVMKSLGENVADVRLELGKLDKFVNVNLERFRDKILKLRDEYESRVMAAEQELHRLSDGQTEFNMNVNAIKVELGSVRRDLVDCEAAVEALDLGKASVGCVEVQQQEFLEFSRHIDALVSGLRPLQAALATDRAARRCEDGSSDFSELEMPRVQRFSSRESGELPLRLPPVHSARR